MGYSHYINNGKLGDAMIKQLLDKLWTPVYDSIAYENQ